MIPESFKEAAWRGTTNTDGEVIGVSFDLTGGETVRLKLDTGSARHAAESILGYLNGMNSHSEMSSGKPSVAGSMPFEGQKQ